MYCSYCFECGNAWSSLEQGKNLQHFPLDREANLYFSILNWVRVSFSRPKPPTQIPVEYTPTPLTPGQTHLEGSWYYAKRGDDVSKNDFKTTPSSR